MARARKLCPTPGCSNYAPCKTHPRGPWAASKRAERTISGSRQQKRARAVLLRDETRCHICGEYGATEVDHVVPLSPLADPAGIGGADDPTNLAPIHPVPCHRDKTAAEAERARRRGQS